MKRGEVWLIDFNPNIGQEIGKKRPAIIVSSDSVKGLKVKVVAPITDASKKARAWHVSITPSKENGLTKDSLVDCNQIKSLSTNRFIKKVGQLNEDELSRVEITLMKVLELIKKKKKGLSM